MRKLLGLAALLVLALVACAGTAEPTSPAATATPIQPTSALPTSPPATTTAPSATDAALPAPSTSPTSSPTSPSPSTADSLWPTFLRELNFGIPAGNSYGPRSLAVHPRLSRLYVRTRAHDGDAPGQVAVLDLATGQVLDLIATGLDSYGEGLLTLDEERNRLYVVNADEATCSVLDATSLKLLTTLQGVYTLALDTDGGRVYVAGLGGLRVLDAADHTVIREASLPHASRFLALAVVPGRDRVYLVYQEGADYLLGQYDSGTLQDLATTDLPGPPDDLVPDPSRDRVYLSLNDGQQYLLWSLDGDGRLSEEQVLGEWTQRTFLALDDSADRLFLGQDRYRDHGITILDLQTGQEVADIALGFAPHALTWDAQSEQLLVSHTYADRISIVDVGARQVSATFPTALDLADLAIDPERGYLYATDSAGQLHVLASETDKELATLPGAGIIAVDSPHGRLYTGGEGADRVRMFDADTLQQTGEIHTKAKPVADAYHGSLYLVRSGIYLASLETMTITAAISDTLPQVPGYSPNPAAVDAVVDPGSGRVFGIINNGVPGSNGGTYLYVYEPVTYEKVLTDTERSPLYVDVDPDTGRAYVSRIHMGGRSTSLLQEGREYTARLESVFGALRVDPILGRVYLSVSGDDEGHLLVLNAENLDVLGSVAIPGRFTLRALDPQRHLLYLATPEGQVQIWSATGGAPTERAAPVTAPPPTQEIYRLFLGPEDSPLFTGSLYRSDDGTQTWQRINEGLPRRGVQEVVISPDFAEDETIFAALASTDEGLGIWRSTDGGQSWRMANRGLSDLAVTNLAISPDFAQDQTLFATARRDGLFRSTDGGQSWIRLTERYYPSETYPQPPGGVFLSPAYGKDSTVFVAHDGLRRSIDGGETWTPPLFEISSLAFSPGFVTDRTLFGWSGDSGVLRSTDGGDTWQPASAGLSLTDFGWGRVAVAPDFATSQTVYFFWTPTASDAPPQLFRSTDTAQTWEYLAGQPSQTATPIQLSADGKAFLALDDGALLVRWPVADLNWQRMAEPPIETLEISSLALSPDFVQDQTMFLLNSGAGILRSGDAGLIWTDTAFPLRATYGLPLELLILSPHSLFVGTPLGLYRFDGSLWAPVGGGLPQGTSVSTPQMGPGGALRVLVSGKGQDEGQLVFLSVDSGQTWTQPVPALPHDVIAQDLRFSPAFASDHTAFLALSWDKPWRTIGGSEWETIGPPGEWGLSALQLSPAFDQDGLLFIRLQDNRLWRSTDGGDSWSDVSGPWGGEAPRSAVPGTGYTLDALDFSPAFPDDSVLLTHAGYTLYRSTDRGATWTPVLDLGSPPVQAAWSPDYARDGTVYLLQGRTLHRSTDRGQQWRELPATPWDELDEVMMVLSPTFAQDTTLLVWTRDGSVYQSGDGGQSWTDISQGLPPANIRQVLFSPGYATDNLLCLVPFGPGLYKRVGSQPWRLSTDVAPPPTPVAAPTSLPAPVVCAIEPARFAEVWQQARAQLGCPLQTAEPVLLAAQGFERGSMIWDSSSGQIYALMESGNWQGFDDAFVEGSDPAYDPTLPPPPQQPQRGFGKVWREQLGGPQSPIGWALEEERSVNGWRQRFDHGLLVWTDAAPAEAEEPGTAYLLYHDGTWQAFAAPAP
ncbi:MAG: hypothetical protein P8189_13300 [Anaerolineae bacterium]